ncbi:hypothetical protein HK405_012457, partial [Cladochytrium tenue]
AGAPNSGSRRKRTHGPGNPAVDPDPAGDPSVPGPSPKRARGTAAAELAELDAIFAAAPPSRRARPG